MKFSVVTPSFNQGPYIEATLASVRESAGNATGHTVQHLVMDAQSTDETLDVLRQQDFAEWVSESDDGQTDAVNKGWARCDGDIISYLCSDDLWEPKTVQLVGDAFAADPELDVVYGDSFFVEGDSGWKRRKHAGPFTPERLQHLNFLSQPATFVRRRVYEKYGAMDVSLRFCMDNEYWLRICGDTRWQYIDQPLASMLQHSAAKTSSQITTAWWETYRMAKRYGLGPRYWWLAMKMQCGGQLYFTMKRRVLGAFGTRRAADGKN